MGWTVDGRAAEARLARFGGAWTGYVVVSDASAIVVNGFKVDPDGLALNEVHDTTPYHQDLHAPIPNTAFASARHDAIDDDPEPEWDSALVHEDLCRLVDRA